MGIVFDVVDGEVGYVFEEFVDVVFSDWFESIGCDGCFDVGGLFLVDDGFGVIFVCVGNGEFVELKNIVIFIGG